MRGEKGKFICVLLAEDHATVRHGLRLLIDNQPDMTVVGEATDGSEAVDRAAALDPDVIVMDLSMPGMNGLAATRAIRSTHPHIAIVALTRHDDDAYMNELLRAGVLGYVLKQSQPSELLEAVRTVVKGGRHLDASLSKAGRGFPSRAKGPVERPTLTDRETEVLRRIAWGYSNKEIAAELDVSVKTVEVHKANAARKLRLRGRIDIVRYAMLQGWLKDE